MAHSTNHSSSQCNQPLDLLLAWKSPLLGSWLSPQFLGTYLEISIYGPSLLLLLMLSSSSYLSYKDLKSWQLFRKSLNWRFILRGMIFLSVVLVCFQAFRAMDWDVRMLAWLGIVTFMTTLERRWSRQPFINAWHHFFSLISFYVESNSKKKKKQKSSIKSKELRSDYHEARFWSRLTWRWMNPLFLHGFKSRLGSGDIPKLPTEFEAQQLQATFLQQWRPSDIKLRGALVRCFWKEFLITGLLAVCKVCVMYVGPALIATFVQHSTEKDHRHFDLKGCLLVLILLVSRYVDVLSSHHFTFKCQKLGLKVRSTLTSAVFRKGLCLSHSARQEHGVGQMVNYMSVDVPQVANTIGALHNVWMLPLQVTVALTLLYSVVGWAMLAGVATLVILVTFTTWTSRLQRRNQAGLLKAKDVRMKATNEVLTSMKVIKLQAWESCFATKLASCRAAEYAWISNIMWTMGSVMSIRLLLSGAVVSIATFVSCLLLGVELTPGSVFTAIATLRLLQDPIRVFPVTVNDICKAQVSLQRLEAYLHSKELDVDDVKVADSALPDQLCVEEGEFSWEDDSKKSTLKNLNVNVKNGELVACVGAVGSGKSSFLASVLGEMHKLHGQVQAQGSMAYVPQTPWIQNGTIEENILFGKPMDRREYMQALEVCQLECDMAALEHGDQTEIGERGINLSGGQKQRIQLARAVYQDSDIYLLDDIFSSVDAHTGSAIFRECVKGVLCKKTIILVTHQVEFLQEVDRILVMCDGTITESGKYEDLRGCSTNFEVLITAHNKAVEKSGIEASAEGNGHTCAKATQSELVNGMANKTNNKTGFKKNMIIDEEQWSQPCGTGKMVYWLYATKAYGSWCIILLFIIQGIWQTLSIRGDYWLADVTSSKTLDPYWFIGVYALFNLGSWMCVLFRTSLGTMAGTQTAQEYYVEMMGSLLRAPMSFFDTTPSSRILNRLSADQSVLDVTLPGYFGSGLSICFTLLGSLFVMCQTSWPIIFIILPLAYLYFLYQAYFIATSRQLTRMRSLTTAPIIHHFSESMAGSAVIRCFQKQDFFYQKHMNSLNENLRMVFHCNAASAWLAYRLEMIGTLVLCSSALLLVLLPQRWLSPQLAGLSLSYGLSLNGALYWTVWLFCELETHMVAVERVKQYTGLPSEGSAIVADTTGPLSNWPSDGAIVLQNLQVRYQPSTPLVLKGISLRIDGGEKVGVVGRTGSGKSTLIQALFRIVEPAGAGSILIDGIDITAVALPLLRSRVAIIPQEPTLFHGTVRFNIDPLGLHSDEEVWDALRSCQLAAFVHAQPGELAAPVMNEGGNWSVGQKQLLCLGRAFLKRARILVLDEASASLDAPTDAFVQQAIRAGFPTSTVINVAHRIATIVDGSHRVLVLQAGRVSEFDAPHALLADPDSLFRSMVREFVRVPPQASY